MKPPCSTGSLGRHGSLKCDSHRRVDRGCGCGEDGVEVVVLKSSFVVNGQKDGLRDGRSMGLGA